MTAEIGSRQILGQEAMKPHLGNRPREIYTSKFQTQFLSGCSDTTENNLKNKNKCLPFHNRFYLERFNFYKAYNRHELSKRKLMANYKQKKLQNNKFKLFVGTNFSIFHLTFAIVQYDIQSVATFLLQPLKNCKTKKFKLFVGQITQHLQDKQI